MKVAIHQPHYFPWLGQMDKMAKSDVFVFLDEVQLTIKSNMYRNRLLKVNGEADYITVAACKHGYREKAFREIELNPAVDWQNAHLAFFNNHYKKAPFYNEIMDLITPFFHASFTTALETALASTSLVMEMLDIHVPTVLQSSLDYDREAQNSDLMLSICDVMNADIYLSGNGARKYMRVEDFIKKDIKVEFQEFTYPSYQQINTNEFIPNLSSLDILFNLGIEHARTMFWKGIL